MSPTSSQHDFPPVSADRDLPLPMCERPHTRVERQPRARVRKLETDGIAGDKHDASLPVVWTGAAFLADYAGSIPVRRFAFVARGDHSSGCATVGLGTRCSVGT